jgi:hypothetical protein
MECASGGARPKQAHLQQGACLKPRLQVTYTEWELENLNATAYPRKEKKTCHFAPAKSQRSKKQGFAKATYLTSCACRFRLKSCKKNNEKTAQQQIHVFGQRDS